MVLFIIVPARAGVPAQARSGAVPGLGRPGQGADSSDQTRLFPPAQTPGRPLQNPIQVGGRDQWGHS